MDFITRVEEDALFLIISYLSRHDIYQWSLVCRKFASIARPLLWRRLEFRYRYMTKSEILTQGPAKYGYSEEFLLQRKFDDNRRSFLNGTLEQDRFFKLHRVVSEAPEIGNLIQEYVLLFKYTYPGVDPLASNILLFLPNLRFLTIQTSFVTSQGQTEELVPAPSMLEGLEKLSLDVAFITFAEVATYMCLPKIKSLSIRGKIQLQRHGVPGVPDSYKRKCSGLQSLTFDWFVDVRPKEKPELYANYKRLLELPISLADLSVRLRVTPPRTTSDRFWNTVRTCPRDISACLEPLKDSLKELEIILFGGANFEHDGSFCDLSTFGVLSKVTISSILVLRTSVHDECDVQLYQLLPVSIRELKIRFLCCSSITMLPPQAWFTDDLTDDLKWLTEISKRKKSHFTGLERVALYDIYQEIDKETLKNQSLGAGRVRTTRF